MQIPTAHLKAIALASAKHDIRYYLNGVCVNDRHIVATDGDRMHAMAHGQAWGHGEVVIPIADVLMALKGRSETIEITPTTIGNVTFTPVDRAYVPYMKVLGDTAQPAQIGAVIAMLNPSYAADAEKAIKAITGLQLQALARVGKKWCWSNAQLHIVVMERKVCQSIPRMHSLERFE